MKQIHEIYPKLPTFTERLNYAFEAQTKSQTKIAEEVGFAQPTFSDLLSGRNKSSKLSEKIAEVLGVDHQWLTTGIPSEEVGSSVTFVNIALIEQFDQYVNTKSRVKIKKPAKYVQLDVKALKNKNINFYDARYMPMTDRGMGMLINEDSPVFFDTTQNFIEDGSTYVISHGGMIQVRQLFNAPLGGVKIVAADPRFESFVLDIDEQTDQLFKVIGYVFAVVNYY